MVQALSPGGSGPLPPLHSTASPRGVPASPTACTAEPLCALPQVDNDQLTLTDCGGETFPHHWLGDGICDDGTGDRGVDLNCNIFKCDNGDCGDGDCAVATGRSAVEIEPDTGWLEAELEAGGLGLFMFDATEGTEVRQHTEKTHTQNESLLLATMLNLRWLPCFQYWVSTRLSASGLQDSVLQILDDSLQQVAQNDNLGRGTRASALSFVAATTGSYVVKVRSYNPMMSGGYSLQVSTSHLVIAGTIPCVTGNRIPNAMTVCQGLNGDTCRFMCMPGYLPGPEPHVCDEATAVYSGGSCLPSVCTGTQGVELSNVSTCEGATGDACSYTCNTGHVEIGQHVCQRDGSFSGGRCDRVICTDGLNLDMSSTTCAGVYEDACEYACADGYSATGAHVCNENGTFAGGVCAMNECTEGTEIAHSPTVCSGTLGDQCVFNCSAGYQPLGEHLCEASGSFAGGVCLRICTSGFFLDNSPTNCSGAGGTGWTLAIRTSGNRHTEWGNMANLANAGPPTVEGNGIFDPFFAMQNVNQIKLVKVDDGTEGVYALPEALDSSLRDTILGCGETDAYTDSVSSVEWTAMYSALKIDGGITMSGPPSNNNRDVSHLLICGVNLESDDDHSVLAFTDNTGQQGNGWSDSWRGDSQYGTIWSLFNDDYKNARGWGSIQGYAGYKHDSNAGTYEVYISDGMPNHPFEGNTCEYDCDSGHSPSGDHVCGANAAFSGGSCVDTDYCATADALDGLFCGANEVHDNVGWQTQPGATNGHSPGLEAGACVVTEALALLYQPTSLPTEPERTSSDSDRSSSYPASAAFDGSLSTAWISGNNANRWYTANEPHRRTWLQYDFGNATAVSAFSINAFGNHNAYGQGDRCPEHFSLLGSNDGEEWLTLRTVPDPRSMGDPWDCSSGGSSPSSGDNDCCRHLKTVVVCHRHWASSDHHRHCCSDCL